MSAPPFNSEELQRYARHLVLPEVGGPGQQKLKAARVLIVGAGGLGAPVLMYLAAAGVGTLGVVDHDTVSLSNLQRQIIHNSSNVEKPKVESARAAIDRINPNVEVISHSARLDIDNAANLIDPYDIVVDGTDNFATRFVVADACENARVPLVSGAVNRFDGSVTTLMPFTNNTKGEPNPRYRDLVPEIPKNTLSCEEAGILGALTGVIGTLQALEVIKLIAGIGEPLIGRQLLFDGMSMEFYPVRYARAGL